MGDFEKKGYTNPKLMRKILDSMNVKYQLVYRSNDPQGQGLILVTFGLQRIQWGGPWTKNGVPMRSRYRHTHWIAVAEKMVFDVNAMCVGGWMPAFEWRVALVPWLLRECEPGADGSWWPTHGIEIQGKDRTK
jgi:hypothetical protein